MKFQVTGRPIFHFSLTDEQFIALHVLAVNHYDAMCKDAARVGGFLYGWANTRRMSAHSALEATFRELDLCCKILEGSASFPELHKIASALASSFGKILREANFVSAKWEVVIDA